MMEKLSFKNRILIGLTLFSMFFGAGNLIFPPHLGAQAGGNVGPALLGFVLSAIGIPVLGVAAVALSDGLENLAQKVHPPLRYCCICRSGPFWRFRERRGHPMRWQWRLF